MMVVDFEFQEPTFFPRNKSSRNIHTNILNSFIVCIRYVTVPYVHNSTKINHQVLNLKPKLRIQFQDGCLLMALEKTVEKSEIMSLKGLILRNEGRHPKENYMYYRTFLHYHELLFLLGAFQCTNFNDNMAAS